MSEPPMVNVQAAVGPVRPMSEVLPNLAERWREMGHDPDQPTEARVFATRNMARKVLDSRPDVSATGAVYIDCRKVEVMSPSFIHELLKAWPLAQPVGANEDVQASWDYVFSNQPRNRTEDVP